MSSPMTLDVAAKISGRDVTFFFGLHGRDSINICFCVLIHTVIEMCINVPEIQLWLFVQVFKFSVVFSLLELKK